MKNIELVIFDWDGTLMDSVGRIVSCMQKAATECRLREPCRDDVLDIIGLSLPVAMERLHPMAAANDIALLIASYSDLYKSRDKTPSPLFDGVDAMLKELHRSGKKLAVATGKSRSGLERVLNETDLGSLFIARRGADEALSKPNPLMLTQILQELSLSPEQAVMVGDSVHDLDMANNLGMQSIGVTWGVNHADLLLSRNPAKLCYNVTELHQFLNQ